MYLLFHPHHRRDQEETDSVELQGDLVDDDISDTWSLPKWKELEDDRRKRDKRMRRLKRARRRKEAQLRRDAELRQSESGDLKDHDSTKSLSEGSDDDEDLPEDMKNRGHWNNSCEFLLSIISMSVGMGNFYRFPFVAYQNGGGAFLLPYVIVLTFVGRPMYFMELAVGQFCSYGQVKCWEMSPFFRGVGFGSALGSFCVVTYYSSVMSVTMYYLINSFRAVLPWSVCDPEWAGKATCDMIKYETARNKSIDAKMLVNLPQLYFERKVMNEVEDIQDGIGVPQPIQTVCLFLAWCIIFLVIVRGVQSSGKVAYFTTFYPYVIIFTMLIIACLKPGATAGMIYFLKPEWKRLAEPKVWFAATGQCFFSLSTGFGPIINYASYNPFHHPIYKDAVIVSVMDTFASFVAGLTVFATLGTIAHALNKPIDEVVDSGPGLVFVIFSDAISNVKYVPQLLSFLFFSMLLTLAIGSAVAWQMASISVISDQFPKIPRWIITTVMCVIGFLIALIYVTPGGQFMLTLVDNFGGNINIYILATLECIGIAWFYGLGNFCRDLEFMLGKKVGWYWKICWGFIIPVILTVVLMYTFVTAKRLEHNGHPFPDSAIICGWLLTATSLIFVPIGAGYAMHKASGTWQQKLCFALQPTPEFGPRRPHDKKRWELFRKGIIAKGGPAPDTFKLPEGQSPQSNTLPDWLEVKEDGHVYPKEDANNSIAIEALRGMKTDPGSRIGMKNRNNKDTVSSEDDINP